MDLNTIGDRSFNVAGPILWNELPKDIRDSKNIEHLKKSLKTHLFNIFLLALS